MSAKGLTAAQSKALEYFAVSPADRRWTPSHKRDASPTQATRDALIKRGLLGYVQSPHGHVLMTTDAGRAAIGSDLTVKQRSMLRYLAGALGIDCQPGRYEGADVFDELARRGYIRRVGQWAIQITDVGRAALGQVAEVSR